MINWLAEPEPSAYFGFLRHDVSSFDKNTIWERRNFKEKKTNKNLDKEVYLNVGVYISSIIIQHTSLIIKHLHKTSREHTKVYG